LNGYGERKEYPDCRANPFGRFQPPRGTGRRYVKGLRIDRKKKIIYLSEVFKFDKKHFDELGREPVNFVLPFLSPRDREFLKKEKLTLEYLDYNWKWRDIENAD